MSEIKKDLDTRAILEFVIKGLDEKQGEDIVCFDVSKTSSITDYTVVASASSSTHLRVLGEYIQHLAKEHSIDQLNRGEKKEEPWGVLDLGVVIVHILNYEARERYHLEDLWKEGEKVDISEWLTPR